MKKTDRTFLLIEKKVLPKIFARWLRAFQTKPRQFMSRSAVGKMKPASFGKSAARYFAELCGTIK